MTESVFSLLSQLPLVGIFVWFILSWSKRIDDGQTARDQQWRDYLQQERDYRTDATKRLAEEIKAIAAEVNRLNGLLSAHDAATRQVRQGKQ